MKLSNGIELKIGCDPEFFLYDKEQYANTSAHIFKDSFGGKHNPTPVPKGAIQVDGTAVEFNIDPASTADEFISNVDEVLVTLRDRISTLYDFRFHPTVTYPKNYFDTLPESAKELGCEPDWDAYTMKVNDKPDSDQPMRTGSGHIHIGWTENLDTTSHEVMLQCATLVKQLDAVLFPASLIWDRDDKRRTMYGKPGAFRPKHYGVEYRVLSNRWLNFKPVQKWIFNSTVKAFELLMEGKVLKEDWKKITNSSQAYSYVYKLKSEFGFEDMPHGNYFTT